MKPQYELFYKQLGLNIAFYRKLRGLTQLDLAEFTDLSRTHISNIEALPKRPAGFPPAGKRTGQIHGLAPSHHLRFYPRGYDLFWLAQGSFLRGFCVSLFQLFFIILPSQ